MLDNYSKPLVIILTFTIALYLSGCTEKDQVSTIIETEISEQDSERRMTDPVGEIVFRYSEFLNPVLLEASENGLFVLDIPDSSKVLMFDWNFDLVNKIGKGTGQGPGEFGGLSDFHVSNDTIYFSDARNAFIHLYSLTNEYIRTISLDGEIPFQVTALGNKPIIKTGSTERLLFVDPLSAELKKGETISTDEVRYRYLLQDRILSDDQNIYRIPFFFGLMIKYDENGRVILARRMVDYSEPVIEDQSMNPEEDPVMVRSDEVDILSVSGAFFGDRFCVLRNNQVEKQKIIDCYRKSDFEYSFSFYPPENIRDFKIHNNWFAAIHDSTLSVWEIDKAVLSQ